jgi:nitrile hydratase accessory protein
MSVRLDPSVGETAGLPRRNGELVFEAPWEARAFGVAVALCRERGLHWDEFRTRLIAEIRAWERDHALAEGSSWSYYERWLASLERLAVDKELIRRDEIDARVSEIADEVEHEHDHAPDHDHDHHH